MKITFPHMGNLHIPVKSLLQDLGHEVIVPPPISKKTISLGLKHSPEFACLPLKINLGNFLEAIEQGADTIMMAGGVGPCRFGYYCEVQREILRKLGYAIEMIVLEPPQRHFFEVFDRFRALAGGKSYRQIWKAISLCWEKIKVIDELEKLALSVRPKEVLRGSVEREFKMLLAEIGQANNRQCITDILKDGKDRLLGLKNAIDGKADEVLKIAIVGEIYVLLEPAVNLNLEKKLGEMGVEVTRSIFISEWIREHLFPSILRRHKGDKIRDAAFPYLKHFVGGHGLETIGKSILYAQDGYDGVIQLAPFTCMPEIIAQSILPAVGRDKGIPVLTIVVDEHAGEAGMLTRLEAFVDLLGRKKYKHKNYSTC